MLQPMPDQWSISAISFPENPGTYKGYLIKMEGDFTCENLNFFTKKVITWLKNINDTLEKK